MFGQYHNILDSNRGRKTCHPQQLDGDNMPYVGSHVDQKLRELKQQQASRRSEVTAANKREEKKLGALLSSLDSKHDRSMVRLNMKLHVTKIEVVRENRAGISAGRDRTQTSPTGQGNDPGVRKLRFGAMRMPSTTARTKVNTVGSSEGSTVNKVYPFHLLRSTKLSTNSAASEKKNMSLSPRPFPILAAKYYRRQHVKETMATTRNKGKSETLLALEPHASEVSQKRPIDSPIASLQSAPLPSLTNQGPPPNSPRFPKQIKESYSRSKTLPGTDGVSNEEIHALRSGKYFLRYSNNTESEKQEELLQNDIANKDSASAEPRSETISRHRSRVNELLDEIESANKPKLINDYDE